jgi:K+-sensing histidine kinase KdpD
MVVVENACMNNFPADTELSRLLSLAAHEVRNPLSVLQGFVRFVLNDTKEKISDKHREYLETAMRSYSRIKEVSDQLSEYSRMVAGEIRISQEPTDLAAVLRDVIDALPPTEREVAVELNAKDTPTIVRADPLWLKRALTSIVTALRLEVGGTNKLSVEQDDGEYQGKPASWILIGDVAQLDVLHHEPKDALGWFNDKERGNLGLSLWIAKWVLNAHGGGIWAPATADKGGGAAVALPHS